MSSGGEPERDDTGLPPVDIEIPDDARELDRDMQAYYRELRADRRRERRRRLHGGLARDGVVLPLLACCLILALITGTLLTVFTATSDQNVITPGNDTNTGPARAGSSAPAAGHSTPAARSSSSPSGQPSGGSSSAAATPSTAASSTAGPGLRRTSVQLPAAGLTVGSEQVPLQEMSRAMLVLIPADCNCSVAVTRLAQISADDGTVLVGTRRSFTEAQELKSQLSPRIATNVAVALDWQNVLAKVVPAQGLTAVVISGVITRGGREYVTYVSQLTARGLSAHGGSLSAALSKAIRD
ncbi:MAG TPA: hypothetical protein VMA32_02710 [Streptosporangiaceae bacterium]|nr:hypothetical protein [Streptosporangiaceae bacterium]